MLSVLGTPLQVTDYAALTARCHALARESRPVAVEFANTHLVTLRRHSPPFRELTSATDLFIPDGIPLVWCMNRAGAGLNDRVYGPEFMRRFITASPGPFSHYLLGGSAECGAKLRDAARSWNAGVQIAGSFHGISGNDGILEGAAEREVIEELNRLSPDFIWVGLGTPKQQAWIHRNKPLLRRGVVLSVGYAFDVNASTKPDAPPWMQRRGLTWLFRLTSEPGRLAGRYLLYNSLFLAYLIWDSVRGRAGAKSAENPPRP